MAAVGTRNTGAEKAIRSVVHRLGYRYSLRRTELPGKPDLVFVSRRKVIFVHGCFWHGHSCRYGRLPKSRPDYWEPKVAANKERDRLQARRLRSSGWSVLTAFDAKARDWINQEVRVGFDREDNQLNEGFKPEWHHIFPRKVVRDGFDDALVDSIANIAVLNEKANRAFSGRQPQQYLQDHGVQPERLTEQSIPPVDVMVVERFEKFLEQRSQLLADRATAFLQGLMG